MSKKLETMAALSDYPDGILLYIAFSSLLFIFFLLYSSLAARNKGGSSSTPVNWPFLGMFPALAANSDRLHDWMAEILAESRWNFSFRGPWFLGMDYFFTCDPANIHHVLNGGFSNYPKGDDFREKLDFLGDGIISSDGEWWKQQRRRAVSAMTSRRFRDLLARLSRSKMDEALLPLLDRFAQRGVAVPDMQDVLYRLALDLSYYTIFGIDLGCLSFDSPTNPFQKSIDDVSQGILYRHLVPSAWWKLLRWLRVGPEKKLEQAWIAADQFVIESIEKKRELLKSSNGNGDQITERDDLLSSYITDSDANYDDHNQVVQGKVSNIMFNKFLRDTGVTLLSAGRETTAAGLTWFFWLLSKHPESQSKILEELKSKFTSKEMIIARSSSTGLISFDPGEVKDLVYLNAAVNESLRLYPPISLDYKAAKDADILPSGHQVRPGTSISLSFYSMARMKGIWGDDCSEFRPERWISEDGRLRHEPAHKFTAFGSGPRICAGMDMALTLMRTVAAGVIYNFHVEMVEGHVAKSNIAVSLSMKNGLPLRLKRRSANHE